MQTVTTKNKGQMISYMIEVHMAGKIYNVYKDWSGSVAQLRVSVMKAFEKNIKHLNHEPIIKVFKVN